MLQNSIRLGVCASFLSIVLSACATPGKIPNTWRSESYLKSKTVKAEEIETTLKSILNGYTADDTSFAKAQNIDTQYRYTRNAAQDYLKAVSNQNCGTFKTVSLAHQSNTNFQLGTVSTVLGVTGGLLSPASTAQALSASSAGFTSLQSQLGQNFYREKTFEILTRAMEVKRKALWADIESKRTRDISDSYEYTINHAIADVIDYNNACSVIAGFEELTSSVDAKERQVDSATAEQKNAASKTLTVNEILANK